MSEVINRKTFLAGRDLAVEMLKAGEEAYNSHVQDDLCGPSTFALEIRDRVGLPQSNYAKTFLEKLQASPELMEGFAAVLSDYFAFAQVGTPDIDLSYGRLKFKEMR